MFKWQKMKVMFQIILIILSVSCFKSVDTNYVISSLVDALEKGQLKSSRSCEIVTIGKFDVEHLANFSRYLGRSIINLDEKAAMRSTEAISNLLDTEV